MNEASQKLKDELALAESYREQCLEQYAKEINSSQNYIVLLEKRSCKMQSMLPIDIIMEMRSQRRLEEETMQKNINHEELEKKDF